MSNNRKSLFSVTRKDLRIDRFRAGGKGGQHQNKTETGVRITHIESGAVGEARDSRSQPDNQRAAFLRMVQSSKFEAWRRHRAAELLGVEAQIEREVQRTTQPQYLRIEGKDEHGRWTELKDEDA